MKPKKSENEFDFSSLLIKISMLLLFIIIVLATILLIKRVYFGG